MKNFFLCLTLLATCQAQAQNALRKFELGATMLTYNANYRGFDAVTPNQVQMIDGLFFRYKQDRWALRLHANYSERYLYYTPNLMWIDALGGDLRSKDFGLGAGFQRSVLKEKDWLYVYGDLFYRTIFSSGARQYVSGPTFNYSLSINAIQAVVGVGAKLKLSDRISLSPEVGYNLMMGWSKYSQTNSASGLRTNYKFRSSSLVPLQFKLHITWSF